MNDFKSYCDLYFPKPVAAVEEEEDHNMDDDDDDDYDPDAKKKKKTKKTKKKAAAGPVNFVYERINERWEICIGMSPDQQSQQGTWRSSTGCCVASISPRVLIVYVFFLFVLCSLTCRAFVTSPKPVSFCNSICTSKGGEHVKYIADEVAKKLIPLAKKKFKGTDIKTSMIKHSMFVFINSLISNPSFDSQTKETLTTRHTKFGPDQFKPKVEEKFLKNVLKSTGLVDEVLHYAKAKQNRQLAKKMGGTKSKKLIIPKLDDANNAGGRKSKDCTLILTEGDSAKSLAIAGLSVIGRDNYGYDDVGGDG